MFKNKKSSARHNLFSSTRSNTTQPLAVHFGPQPPSTSTTSPPQVYTSPPAQLVRQLLLPQAIRPAGSPKGTCRRQAKKEQDFLPKLRPAPYVLPPVDLAHDAQLSTHKRSLCTNLWLAQPSCILN